MLFRQMGCIFKAIPIRIDIDIFLICYFCQISLKEYLGFKLRVLILNRDVATIANKNIFYRFIVDSDSFNYFKFFFCLLNYS